MVPWATGKSPMTHAYVWFLASWAKVLSWKETARRFRTTWDTVFRAVEHAVRWGLEHRNLEGIRSIGVDELSGKKGPNDLPSSTKSTMGVAGCSTSPEIGPPRAAASFNGFFDLLGAERTESIVFVASDMWKAFLKVRTRCVGALHVLGRFHVLQLMSKAIDETRRKEVRALRTSGRHVLLTKTRGLLLKRPKNLTRKERGRLRERVSITLRSVQAYLLKEQLQQFWRYRSVTSATRLLDGWIRLATRSRIDPLKKFARTLRQHRTELRNWFIARRKFAAGATEGLGGKARITTRRAYGFRTFDHAQIGLYHALGNLPEPPGSPTDSSDEATFVTEHYRAHEPFARLPPSERKRRRAEVLAPLLDDFSRVGPAQASARPRAEPPEQSARLRAQPRGRAAPRAPRRAPRARHHAQRARPAHRGSSGARTGSCTAATHAQAAAAIFSIIASCRLHGLGPQRYLEEILLVPPWWPRDQYLDLARTAPLGSHPHPLPRRLPELLRADGAASPSLIRPDGVRAAVTTAHPLENRPLGCSNREVSTTAV